MTTLISPLSTEYNPTQVLLDLSHLVNRILREQRPDIRHVGARTAQRVRAGEQLLCLHLGHPPSGIFERALH